MSQSYSLNLYVPLLILCIAFNYGIWSSVWHANPPRLRISVLSIGQGDSILIQGPTGITILIDGGPDRSVLRQLGQELPLFSEAIDLVVETHPDTDHIAGLAPVFDQYAISYFMSPGMPDRSQASLSLRAAVTSESGVTTFIARRGMRIHIGGGAYADVLYPDRNVSKGDTNSASVVMHIVYGKTSFMLTGDLPSPIEDYLVRLEAVANTENGTNRTLHSDVLKAGHHGSKNSTDDIWLAAVHPSMVAISAGKDNTYGHPNPETLARVRQEGANLFSTIDRGTLHFISDGSVVIEK
jgi:competence protein ComEC